MNSDYKHNHLEPNHRRTAIPSSSHAAAVGIYRLQLFKPSETFIGAQARALRTYLPLLLGRTLFGPADPVLENWVPPGLHGAALMHFLLTASPAPYLEFVRSRKLALIHAHFSVDGIYALPLARKLGVPLVTTLHGFDVTTKRRHFLGSGRPALVRYALLQGQLKHSGERFICISHFIREAALRAGFPEHKLHVHYIGIDTAQFTPAPAGSTPRFVHVARLVEKKGTRYLLLAFAQLYRKFSEARLDIIGDGPLRAELVALAVQLGIGDAVRFHGVQTHAVVRAKLRGATALMLPSVTAVSGDAEGLPIVLLEAFATGVPVIGTLHGGIPEAIDHGRTGFLVPERDSMALALGMDALLDDATLQARMGIAAREVACDRFDIQRQTHELENHYRGLSA